MIRNGIRLGSICTLLVVSALQAQVRTVAASEAGSIFGYPNGFSWTDLGAYVGSHESSQLRYMKPEALKILHTRFHLFKPSDDTTWNWFPYAALRTFEKNEVAAGRPPIFITATYMGKKRPVVWNWSLGLQGQTSGVPKTSSSNWEYAVNVADDRFINFWINNYVRNVLFRYLSDVQNKWVGLDECAFTMSLYGVLDDNNNFVPGVKWDPPFAQTETDFFASINYFFNRVKTLAPDVRLMPNSGTISDWTKFAYTYGQAPGSMVEEINPASNNTYVRNKQYSQIKAFTELSAQGKVQVLKAAVNASDPSNVRSGFVMYALLNGANTFYAPRIAGSNYCLPISAWMPWKNKLGSPLAQYQSYQQPGTPSTSPGFRLYWREFQGGIVYVNWTGTTKTITLPTNRKYYDVNGNPITTLTIPDLQGHFAFTPISTSNQPPTVSLTAPANGATYSAPATFTLTAAASGPEWFDRPVSSSTRVLIDSGQT